MPVIRPEHRIKPQFSRNEDKNSDYFSKMHKVLRIVTKNPLIQLLVYVPEYEHKFCGNREMKTKAAILFPLQDL